MFTELKKFGISLWDEIRHLCRRPREVLLTVLSLCCVILAALMLWKVLVIAAGSPSPVVVVLSGSMLPAFSRGDILFLHDKGPTTNVGDIVVFKVEGREIPIVHRVLNLHKNAAGETRLLTKGDNNSVDDRGLYARRGPPLGAQNFARLSLKGASSAWKKRPQGRQPLLLKAALLPESETAFLLAPVPLEAQQTPLQGELPAQLETAGKPWGRELSAS
ncbi:Os06g0273800 protein, related [Eimeria tenella]|uniref:Signal peptidase complex catalytic subunit SEC11 n=1 Tax=Eimeria tenella TaxID=5802 RepID=U6KY20_EIMTE|nr:Os06g0273800 protein, related [Eimeria tenella]CDJ43042.1 Os06g0273800 protein, related [Eimeria tenella]|eukprot:XP_013233792.1 Os06g0273800 protein, related [Eimeria tenella]